MILWVLLAAVHPESMLLLTILLALSPALEAARGASATGNLDALVQLADAVPAEESVDAARLLADAAARAKARDKLLALQLAQMAVRRDPRCSRALELLTTWALAEKEFTQAKRYAAAWIRAYPADANARRTSARVDLLEQSWHPIRIHEVHPRTRSASAAAEPDAAAPDSESAAAASAHFRILYTRGAKDWSDRGRYEVAALDLLERAWFDARSQLGESPPGRFEVVLYTRDEFSQRYGAGAAGQILGFYSGKIRLNLSEALNGRFQATALHELVHAALDGLAGGHGDRLPMWLNEGLARFVERKATTGAFLSPRQLRLVSAQGDRLPLASMAHISFAHLGGGIELAYAKSAAAVAALVGGGEGMIALTRLTRAVGRGSSFDSAFSSQFGSARLGSLDQEAVKMARR